MPRFQIALFLIALGSATPCLPAELAIRGEIFTLDGKPFPYTGLSFFNAIYNPAFNASVEARQAWLDKFASYGINALRIWAQWDNKRGFVDACPVCSLYLPGGALREDRLAVLRSILGATDQRGMVVELVLFSQESWRENLHPGLPAAEKAVRRLAEELRPYRNFAFQIWNEHSLDTVALVKLIKSVDPKRLVTISPGFAGVLTAGAEETALIDYLTPHTSRQGAGKPWIVGPAEIRYLKARYRKPVVDDEPARNGTPSFGGPREPTSAYDHILQIWETWKAGGYVTYHHDMFQTGAGSAAVPPSGIPDPEFSPYHRAVFEFLKMRARYAP